MSDQAEEVRFEYLRPQQIRDRRRKADVAILPLGTLEWHGIQNPTGCDGLKVHHIACQAVRKLNNGGGVVFPALYWGVPRDIMHVDTCVSEAVTRQVAEAYGTDVATLKGRTAPHGGVDVQEQWLAYQRLLRMCLEQIAGFGFSSIYLCSGHSPLVHFARPVAIAFSRAMRMNGRIVTTDWGGEGDAAGLQQLGDHAGRWETSHMLAAVPASVDMNALQQQPEYVGVGGNRNAVEADAEQGQQWIEQCATGIANECRWLVENYPSLPARHQHLR